MDSLNWDGHPEQSFNQMKQVESQDLALRTLVLTFGDRIFPVLDFSKKLDVVASGWTPV